MRRAVVVAAIVIVAAARMAAAQPPEHLTLKDAETRALAGHPVIQAGQYNAKAVNEVAREVRSAYLPTIVASSTGAESVEGSRIAAGGLNNPTVLDRFAYGVLGAQLLDDFGRTSSLSGSASLRVSAAQQDVEDRRASVLLQVDISYFKALQAQAVLRVANETVTARQLVVDQATQLSAAGLKSELDVSFATVNLGEAKLLLLQAGNDAQASFASLSSALGSPQSATYDLEDVPPPSSPPSDSAALIAEALKARPDVARERFAEQAAERFADAEGDLRMPTLSLLGAAGLTPFHEAGLTDHYAAIGVTVTVPVLNGGQFSARHAEAQFRANAQQQVVRDLEDRIARDVQTAWLDAQTSFQRLDLTNQLLDQATQSLELAQQRYGLGLSSIVELTQAQLNLTRAQIDQATARYEFAQRSAALRFQTGTMK